MHVLSHPFIARVRALLAAADRVVRDDDGGHMTHPDDLARAAQKEVLRAFDARSVTVAP